MARACAYLCHQLSSLALVASVDSVNPLSRNRVPHFGLMKVDFSQGSHRTSAFVLFTFCHLLSLCNLSLRPVSDLGFNVLKI